MSSVRLLILLALKDLRRRRSETLLLLLALTIAATTLTLGLVLHGQTADPYSETRARTAGPDVVAAVFPPSDPDGSRLTALAAKPEVRASSPVVPTTWADIRVGHVQGVAEVQGRGAAPSPVDRPEVVEGHWLHPGSSGVVLERAFARAIGARVGDRVMLGGLRDQVVGVAVSAALPPYPQLCTVGCVLAHPGWGDAQPGLAWVPRHLVKRLATKTEPVVPFQFLALSDPASAREFARSVYDGSRSRPTLVPWQDVAARQAEQLASERTVVVFGSSLLVPLALATLVVLVGGRMLDETRRVGTLKAAGATPGFVVRVLLASYLVVAALGSGLGIVLGRLIAPLLVTKSAGMVGDLGSTTVTPSVVLAVSSTSVAIVVLAGAVPAWRAARTTTVRLLTNPGRAPKRHPRLIAASSMLPTPALFGLRIAARRPRRAYLTALSTAVAVCGAVVALSAQHQLTTEAGAAKGPADPLSAQLHTVLVAVTLLVSAMTAVNVVFVSRTAAIDSRKVLATARALGMTPGSSVLALGIAQLVPAVLGVAAGAVAGTATFRVLATAHTDPAPLGQLALLLVAVIVTIVVLAAVPTAVEARRPIARTINAT